jgi:hypothetical protein
LILKETLGPKRNVSSLAEDGATEFSQPPGKLPGKGAQTTFGSDMLLGGLEKVQLKSPTKLMKGRTLPSTHPSRPFNPVPLTEATPFGFKCEYPRKRFR